jgi:flagellar motor switch/type III secretory pathway protein FliN
MSQIASQTQPSAAPGEISEHTILADERAWGQVGDLPCDISIEVPVPGFGLKDLLALRRETVLVSRLPTSDSPPLRINGELVAWCDFEVLGTRLAVRITELA